MIAPIVISALALAVGVAGVWLTLALDPRSFLVWPASLLLMAVSIGLEKRQERRDNPPPRGRHRR